MARLSKVRRLRILARDGAVCRKCGATANLSIDHIVPSAAGGGYDDDNLQVLCLPCNMSKGDGGFHWTRMFKCDAPHCSRRQNSPGFCWQHKPIAEALKRALDSD